MAAASGSRNIMVLCLVGLLAVGMLLSGADATLRSHRGRADGQGSETVPLLLDHRVLIPTVSITAIHDHSISPWTYNTTYNENLYPPTLTEAKCLLTGCRNESGQEDMKLLSKPIRQQVLVLRRVQDHGKKYQYRLETRIISVGCTCVRPIVHHQE